MLLIVSIIPISSLMLVLVPVAIVLWIQFRWSLDYKEGLTAVSRMLGQLLIIGYFLGAIFNSDSAWVIVLILAVMVLSSSWIALRTIKGDRKRLFLFVAVSIIAGGATTLILVTQGVLQIDPWYKAQYMIPLAGMIFANSMNGISLAAERFYDEISRDTDILTARNIAFRTSMIPITNSLFAVGLVSIPGMMTGQILSGIDPLIAVRYQIMVMAMIYGSDGISSALFLYLVSSRKEQ